MLGSPVLIRLTRCSHHRLSGEEGWDTEAQAAKIALTTGADAWSAPPMMPTEKLGLLRGDVVRYA